jgi:indolepyruvate ferredoxin oxidoreductase alpha subunit
MMAKEFLLGNGAIALGLLEAGSQVVTSYPGTPSSEILPEAIRLARQEGLKIYTEWSTNEKVALDNAFAAAVAGKRAACIMKQVGLNVAAIRS